MWTHHFEVPQVILSSLGISQSVISHQHVVWKLWGAVHGDLPVIGWSWPYCGQTRSPLTKRGPETFGHRHPFLSRGGEHRPSPTTLHMTARCRGRECRGPS